MASKSKVTLSEPTLNKLLAARSLSRDSLNIACPESVCNELALRITSWKVLCPFIKLKEVDEANIDADYRKNAGKKIGMLRVWRQELGAEATYLCLADAFETLKWRDQIIELLDLFDKQKQQCRDSNKKDPTIPKLGDCPKPHEIIRVMGISGEEIVIRDQLASHWEDLCLVLEFQPPSLSSSMIENISRNCQYQVEECCREVLLKWLSGATCSSGPVTWRTLIKVIRKISFEDLADQLEHELKP